MWRVLFVGLVVGSCYGAPRGHLTFDAAHPQSLVGDHKCAQMDFMCRGRPYTVRRGESLLSLANEFGCQESDLLQNNPHLKGNGVVQCDEVCIPLKEGECQAPEYRAIHFNDDPARLSSSALLQNTVGPEGSVVIPKPKFEVFREGFFQIKESTTIVTMDDCELVANQLAEMLRPATGFALPVKVNSTLEDDDVLLQTESTSTDNNSTNNEHLDTCDCIRLELDSTMKLNDEGYELVVDSGAIVLKAPTSAGLFYAMQTLRQLLPDEIEKPTKTNAAWRVARTTIHDEPAYKWRGLMLDVSRHFFTANEVKHMLDMMALHKMNVFHWHLTDDQGWRMPIPQFPEIAEKAAWRDTNTDGSDGLYGGCYTQAEIMDVVLYAQSLHIEVIPEIDMPGHSQALLVSHPELGNDSDSPVQVMDEWGVSQYTLDPTNQHTFHMVDSLIHTLAEFFPSDYVHIGGDEADQTQWRRNFRVKELMSKLNMKNYDQVQGYFEMAVHEMLKRRSKKMIGWDELLRGGLPPGATVMSWEGTKPGVEAAMMGHDVVMCPMEHAYFDRKYTSQQPMGRLGVMPLMQTYKWDPRSVPGATPEIADKIIGVQGNIWTEGMVTLDDVEYLSMPRISALAEVGWTPNEKRSFPSFVARAQELKHRMDVLGVLFPLEQSM